MEYKITFLRQFRVLKGALIFQVIFIIGYVYSLRQLDNGHGVFTMVFLIGYAVCMLPTLLLHIEYLIRNRSDVITIDPLRKLVTINNKQFAFDDIEKITLYMPHTWHREDHFRPFPFEEYRYSQIDLKDGKEFIMTCLMSDDLQKVVPVISGVKLEKKVRQIASPWLEMVSKSLLE